MMTGSRRAYYALAIVFFLVPAFSYAQDQGIPVNTQLQIRYEPPSDAKLRQFYDEMKSRNVLERLQGFMAPLRLRKPLNVRTAQCGAETRPYRPGGTVTLCYELVQRIAAIAAKNAKDQNELTMILFGTVVQSLLQQVALAVFDQLEIPVWGRLEDAADKLAAFIMVEFGDKVALTTILGTGKFFLYSGNTWTGADFARTDSHEGQRFYNYLCIAYGGDPVTFDFLRPRPGPSPIPRLTEFRAPRCEGEYLQVRIAFSMRIMPFVDPDRVVAVRATQWLRPDETPGVAQ